jgi:hypothetical protein
VPITQEDIQRILSRVQEQNAVLRLAPISPKDLIIPGKWKEALSQDDPVKAVLDSLWKPVADNLPRTLRVLRRSLQGIGLLSTLEMPLSLVYFFRKNGKAYAFRGYLPGQINNAEHVKLPAEFLGFYQIHDGWVDIFSRSNGPAPSNTWLFLSEILDAPEREVARADFNPEHFLVVFNNGGGSYLGFDLSQPRPLCFIWWKEDPPEIVPDFWKELDEWIAADLGNFDSIDNEA